MTAERAVAEYYDAWRNRRGDMSGVPLADDFRFLGPVASVETVDGYGDGQPGRTGGHQLRRPPPVRGVNETRLRPGDGAAFEALTEPLRRELQVYRARLHGRAPAAPAASAFESGAVLSVIALLTDDALMTMPPEAAEYIGPQAIGHFLSTVPASGSLERFRLIPTRANGQPAFGCYLKDPHTRSRTPTASWCSRCAATASPASSASATPPCSRRSGCRGR